MKHFRYLKYIVRHKWFVLVAGLKIGAPLWRLIVHDLSKFFPDEWIAYANFFYANGKEPEFNVAWLYHQRRNKHHWQYWILREDCGNVTPIEMPKKYVLEMVADWMGAGRAITGKWEAASWFEKNGEVMLLHEVTRSEVDNILARTI